MAFQIIRNDITKVRADAIVNTANHLPVIGKGTDSSIYFAAGKERLLEERKKIGIIERGQAAFTNAYNLEKNGVKYIIHTVGITYFDGSFGERTILRSCYANSLKIARRLNCKSIAFPLLASGSFHFPKGMALEIAIEEIDDFLSEYEMDITLVVYDKQSFSFAEKFECDIKSFIDENYINNHSPTLKKQKYYFEDLDKTSNATTTIKQLKIIDKMNNKSKQSTSQPDINTYIKSTQNPLDFKNSFQKLIAEKNMANADVYRNTSVDRKFFSKIISPKNQYIPKKEIIFQFGLNLKLQINEFEKFLASANYAFNPHEKLDVIIKFCIINNIFSISKINSILFEQNVPCFFD